MSGSEDARAPEILIIRRKSSGEDDCHHGGVWKIAYADFMTAMMAFFLVMWLINAANDSIKASVASYFNPMRLTDAIARSKGLKDPKERNNSKTKEEAGAPEPGATGKPGEAVKGAIDNAIEERRKLALDFDRAAPEAMREDNARSRAVSLAGRAFRDPFNPQMPAQTLKEGAASTGGAAPVPAGSRPNESSESPAAGRARDAAGRLSPAPDGMLSARPGEGPEATGREQPSNVGPTKAKDASSPTTDSPGPTGDSDGARLTASAAEVEAQLKAAIDRLGISGGPGVDVAVEGDGIVLSLTDTSSFGMFAIGSSTPGAELARLMQVIAPIVLANGDRIVLRGHTDSRPFRGDRGSNWRLSMERAEAAQAMLLKAGVDERRFERIEAHADQKPKTPSDGAAAVNRRIEILLRRTRT